MNSKRLVIAALAIILLGTVGCQSATPAASSRSSDPGALVTTRIDPADFRVAANQLIKSLFESKGFVEQVAGRKPLVALSLIKNNSSDRYLDSRLLSSKVFDAINKDARMEISQNLGIIADGSVVVIDELGLQIDDLKRMRAGDKGIRIPDLTLSGEILSAKSSSGKSKEFLHHFHLKLARGNTVVWQDSAEIRKSTGPRTK